MSTAPSPRPNGPLALAALALLAVDAVLLAAWLRRGGAPEPAPAPAPTNAPADGRAATFAATPQAEPPAASTASATPDDAAAATGAGERSALVFGTVRAAGGEPVGKGLLLATGDAPQASAEIAAGTFALRLPPGAWTLRTRVEDAVPCERTVDVRAPHTRVDLQLDTPWRVTVYARTPDGRPLMDAARERMQGLRWFRGLCALAFPDALTGDLPPSNRDEYPAGLGRFRGADVFRTENVLPKDSVGLLVLPPDRAVHVALLMRNVVLAQQLVAPGTAEVTFTLSVDALLARTATVRARVVDDSGRPVVGARVALNDANTTGGGAPADGDGRVTLRHLKPGLLNLEVAAKGFVHPPVQVPVAGGADVDLGDLVLRAPVAVELAFAGGDGPLSVRTAALPPLPRDGWHARTQWASQRPEPTVALALAPGRYGVLATRGDRCALLELDTAALPPQPVAVELRPGALLRVRARMAPAVGRITVRSARGVVVLDEEVLEVVELAARVPPGTYDLDVAIVGRPTVRRALHVAARGVTVDLP